MSIIDDKSKLVTWKNLGSSYNIAAEANKPNFSATDIIWFLKKITLSANGIFMVRSIVNQKVIEILSFKSKHSEFIGVYVVYIRFILLTVGRIGNVRIQYTWNLWDSSKINSQPIISILNCMLFNTSFKNRLVYLDNKGN